MVAELLMAASAGLGLFVIFGGAYGVLYGVGVLRHDRGLTMLAHGCYVAQCIVLVAIVFIAPLLALWKALLVVSGAAYYVIPPVTWQYLQRLHASERHLQ